jgi:hypothetical protein
LIVIDDKDWFFHPVLLPDFLLGGPNLMLCLR